jgi:two-component system chemotaxis response regulator CheY
MGRFLSREFDCVVDRADTREEALAVAGKQRYDLVLVNRVLARDGSAGMEVIREMVSRHPKVRVMLVSDLAGAQDEAVGLGAMRGFGKAALASPETEALLRSVLVGD